MKKSSLILFSAVLLLSLLLPSGINLAAPSPQNSDQIIQIVLVLDVSGSMSTPVYTGIVPEDLLSLLLRLDELTQDSEYIDLQEQIEEAENQEAVQETKDMYHQAFEDLSDWIANSQGVSLSEIQAEIRAMLGEEECEDRSDRLIATAGTADQIMLYLNADCPATTNKWTLHNELLEYLPYLSDPEYQALREAWQAAYQAYDKALEESGYTSLSDMLEEYKQSTGMQEIQDEIDRLVAEYGIPSRLELAKSAAINLIDLSQLDKDRTGRESLIGLVTFSNQAMFEQGLTLDHKRLKPLIQSMRPLEQTNIGDALSLGLSELENNADPDQPQMVILLSDGHANVGLSSSEILSVFPYRANQNDIILCTAGFADLETEVDFLLLEGLAYQTNGEYLFTNSGAELGSFFAACREAAAGKELAGQISGIIPAGDIKEIGSVDVEANSCELSLALNFLSGTPLIELTNPNGKTLDLEAEDISYQSVNQVQLLSVLYPEEGEWSIKLSNNDSDEEDAAYSLVISIVPCLGDENPPQQITDPKTTIPFLLTSRGMSVMTGGIIALIVILGGGAYILIRIRQRKSN